MIFTCILLLTLLVILNGGRFLMFLADKSPEAGVYRAIVGVEILVLGFVIAVLGSLL